MKETTFRPRNGNTFRLRHLSNGQYQIHKNGGRAFEGSRRLILRAAVEMSLTVSQFRIAVKELRKMDHDYADFGVFGMFLYTQSDRKAA